MTFESLSTDSHNSELSALQKRIERLKLSNDDTVKQLSETTSRWKRLAKSLGFDDVHEAQVAVDTADYDVSYKECFERVHKLEEKVKSDKAALERLKNMEEENGVLKMKLKLLEEENTILRTKLAKAGRNKKFFPLDTDTTSRLLSISPTFAALLPLLLTSKFVYGVFQARRESIVHEIASNQLGTVLPQALRLARCEDARLLQRNVEDLPKEEDVYTQEITPSQARILTRNAQTVQELEDYYSFRRKDRMSRTSVLGRVESKRFKRAMYRIMLLSFAYGLDSFSYQDKALRQFFSDPDELDRNYVKQKRFLNRFVSEGLCEIYKVSQFLQKMAFWAVGADGSFAGCLDVYDWDLEGTYLAAGPAVILDCYKNSTAHMHTGPVLKRFKEDNGPYSKFITLAVEIILKERDVAKPGPFATVLDSVNGGEDRCCHCQMRSMAVDLWNESNWDDLKGDMGLDLHIYLKGKLFTNAAERGLISTLQSINYSTLMHEMYDSRRGVYRDWSKDKSVCFDCIEQFFLKTLPLWWLDRKRKARIPIMRDCRYGYDCPEQKQLRHAQLFNHLCEPSRKVPIAMRIEDSYE